MEKYEHWEGLRTMGMYKLLELLGEYGCQVSYRRPYSTITLIYQTRPKGLIEYITQQLTDLAFHKIREHKTNLGIIISFQGDTPFKDKTLKSIFLEGEI